MEEFHLSSSVPLLQGMDQKPGKGLEESHTLGLGTKLSSCCAVGPCQCPSVSVLWGSRAIAHMFPRTPLQVCSYGQRERTNWETSSLEGPALLGLPLPLAEAGVISRWWGLTLVQADRLGQGVQGAVRVMGPLSGQFSPQIGPDQGEASQLATAIARAGEEQGAQLPSCGGHWLVPLLKS